MTLQIAESWGWGGIGGLGKVTAEGAWFLFGGGDDGCTPLSIGTKQNHCHGCIAWCVNYISIKPLRIIEALKKTCRKFRSSYERRNKSPSSSRKETKVFTR